MDNLAGTTHAVFGVANQRSIAWSIAQKLRENGARIILACHPDLASRVQRLADATGMDDVIPCDVESPEQVEECFRLLARQVEALNGVVHSIAFSDKNELQGRFIDTSAENFRRTMHISCYSFIEIARRSAELMQGGGSILTLTFDASRPWPHYNVMGPAKAALETSLRYAAADLGEFDIRVNAISASPEDTLSARGIKHFRVIGDWAEGMSPLGRRATLEEIANEAVYLLGSGSTGVTGQIRFVDCGSSITNLPPVRNAAKIHSAMGRVLDIVRNENEKKD